MVPDAGSMGGALIGPPRLRGDGPYVVTGVYDAPVAAPPARGWSVKPYCFPRFSGGRPACAGMVPSVSAKPTLGYGPPRLRGDGPVAKSPPMSMTKAAPPARGWSLDQCAGL